MICKNCQNDFEGNFCNECGQSAAVRRLDFSYLYKELPNSIFQLNRGFFFTAKELLLRPGHAIRAFIAGERKPYYQPVAFLLVVSTIYLLVNYLLGTNAVVEDFLLGFESGATDAEGASNSTFRGWITKYQVYIPLLVLPLFSIASYLAFLKSGYNYTEHLVLNIYITAQQFIIYTFFCFLLVQYDAIILLQMVVGIAFVFWTYIQFFVGQKVLPKLARILFTYLYFILLNALLFFLVGLVYWLMGG